MTPMLRLLPVIAIALSACAPRTPPASEIVQPAGIEPLPTAADDGLAERKPDLCKASTYAAQIGQPGSVIPMLGISRDYRVVEFRGIEPQEYDPNRIVFRLDANGMISGVDCG